MKYVKLEITYMSSNNGMDQCVMLIQWNTTWQVEWSSLFTSNKRSESHNRMVSKQSQTPMSPQCMIVHAPQFYLYKGQKLAKLIYTVYCSKSAYEFPWEGNGN